MKSSAVTYLVILAGAILWCAAFMIPPVLLSGGGGFEVVGAVFYQPFHTICHQLPERSMHLLGKPVAVCMRCSAIYLGFLVGTLLCLPMRSWGRSIAESRGLLVASILPMVVDVVLDELGLHASTEVTRILTGSVFGIIIPFYVVPAAQQAVQELVASSRLVSPSDLMKGNSHA